MQGVSWCCSCFDDVVDAGSERQGVGQPVSADFELADNRRSNANLETGA